MFLVIHGKIMFSSPFEKLIDGPTFHFIVNSFCSLTGQRISWYCLVKHMILCVRSVVDPEFAYL